MRVISNYGSWAPGENLLKKFNAAHTHTQIFFMYVYVLFTMHTDKKFLWRLRIFTSYKIRSLHLFDLHLMWIVFCSWKI